MPKQKTRSTIKKRFKVTSKGLLLRRHAQTSHLKRKVKANSKPGKQKVVPVNKTTAIKLKKLI